jgi:hypothetical protein
MHGGEVVSIEFGVIFIDSTPENGEGDSAAPSDSK